MNRNINRRLFLQASGAGLAGVTLAGTFDRAMAQSSPSSTPNSVAVRATGQPMPVMDIADKLPLPPHRRLGWAVMGLGHLSLNLILPSIAETRLCKLTALVSGNAEKAKAVATAYGIPQSSVYSYDNFDQIRNNPDVDIVYIVLPNALHAEWTIRTAEAGKHVLCEKPMAATVEQCQAMIDACNQANRKLMIAYRAQYEPYNLEAIRLVQDGEEVGKPRVIVADHGRILDPSRPRDQWRAQPELAGGGSLYDIGIYSLNATRYLTGEEPTEIRAMMRPGKGDFEVEENIEWNMLFPSGAIANCSSSYHYTPTTQRIMVQGEKGVLIMDPATAYFERKMWIKRDGTHIEQRQLRDANQFALEMDHMSESVMENKQPKTPGLEGLRDVRLMQIIYEAAQTGRPISVPPLT